MVKGGEVIKNIDPECLLKNYSIVFQDVNLFNNTIMENIRIGRKDAPIVLLDEATASFDAENETIVQEAISNTTKGKTVIVIAHRMRTIENADKVIVLDKRKVVEEGNPQ